MKIEDLKGNKQLILALSITALLIIAIGCAFIFSRGYRQNVPWMMQNIACTLEAKLCPDGTSVGRTGPDCQFAACPVKNGGDVICQNSCGDGICQELVCLAAGCPCAESAATCPADCRTVK